MDEFESAGTLRRVDYNMGWPTPSGPQNSEVSQAATHDLEHCRRLLAAAQKLRDGVNESKTLAECALGQWTSS